VMKADADDLEWIFFNVSLKQSDCEAFYNGRKLTDIHINAVQRILSNQIPSFFGLDSLLNSNALEGGLTITLNFFCHGCHWITAGCREELDPLFNDVDEGLKQVRAV